MFNRRMLFKVLGAAGAAPVLSKELVTASPSALPPLPLNDMILKILRPYNWQQSKTKVELLNPNIYRIIEEVRTWSDGKTALKMQVSFGHVRSAVYGEDHISSMLGDPLGRAKLFEKCLGDKYYPGPGEAENFARIGSALLDDGRAAEGLKFMRAARASRVHNRIMEKFKSVREERNFSPRLFGLLEKARLSEDHDCVDIDALPRELMRKSRTYKELTAQLEGYQPRKKDKTWWDAFYQEYRRTRSSMAAHQKWGEYRWMVDIWKQRRQRWSWTIQYKRKRFAHFSRELAGFKVARDKILESLVEHASAPIEAQGPYSNVGVETCLRVIRRLDALMTIPMEAITMPPDISPANVAITMLGQTIRNMFGRGERI